MMIQKIFRAIILEITDWFEYFLSKIPGKMGNMLRVFYWRFRFKKFGSFPSLSYGFVVKNPRSICIGNNVNIMQDCKLYANSNGFIRIGNNVSCNSNVLLGASEGGKIIIGNNVLIGPNTVLRASNHIFDRIDIPIKSQGHRGGLIVLENDIWLGANVVVLPNVRIGEGSIIGAGAVVTKDIEPFSIAVGVPAKKIKNRNEYGIV